MHCKKNSILPRYTINEIGADSPKLGLVEQAALGSLQALVLVEAEVPVDAAGLVLGLPYVQAGQGQDNKHDNANDEPFHD